MRRHTRRTRALTQRLGAELPRLAGSPWVWFNSVGGWAVGVGGGGRRWWICGTMTKMSRQRCVNEVSVSVSARGLCCGGKEAPKERCFGRVVKEEEERNPPVYPVYCLYLFARVCVCAHTDSDH